MPRELTVALKVTRCLANGENVLLFGLMSCVHAAGKDKNLEIVPFFMFVV